MGMPIQKIIILFIFAFLYMTIGFQISATGISPGFSLRTCGFLALSSISFFLPLIIVFWADIGRLVSNLQEDDFNLMFGALSSVFIFLSFAFYDSGNLAPTAILLGSFFATLGWVYTSFENRRNARKSHTLNVLLQMRNSAEFMKHRTIFVTYLKNEPYIDRQTINRLDDEHNLSGSLGEAVLYLTNYYEFICAAYVDSNLDKKLLTRSLRSLIINYHDIIRGYILDARREDPVPGNPLIFENLVAVAKELRESRERDLIARKKVL